MGGYEDHACAKQQVRETLGWIMPCSMAFTKSHIKVCLIERSHLQPLSWQQPPSMY